MSADALVTELSQQASIRIMRDVCTVAKISRKNNVCVADLHDVLKSKLQLDLRNAKRIRNGDMACEFVQHYECTSARRNVDVSLQASTSRDSSFNVYVRDKTSSETPVVNYLASMFENDISDEQLVMILNELRLSIRWNLTAHHDTIRTVLNPTNLIHFSEHSCQILDLISNSPSCVELMIDMALPVLWNENIDHAVRIKLGKLVGRKWNKTNQRGELPLRWESSTHSIISLGCIEGSRRRSLLKTVPHDTFEESILPYWNQAVVACMVHDDEVISPYTL
eukprot:PhF_6_TR9998/c0_g1_i1/m.15212